MPDIFRQTIWNLLEALPTRHVDALKQLIWTELNFDRTNTPLSIRDWPESLRQTLAEPPLLFGTAGEGNGFHVIFTRLQADDLLSKHERPIIARLLADHPYALFVFSNAKQTHWHFVNVKLTSNKPSTQGENKEGMRRIFRRIAIGPGERLRTATERLAMLDIASLPRQLFGIPPLVIQNHCDDAFDVEKVTRAFFTDYRRIFEEAEHSLPADLTLEQRRLYTQKFFNRMMFLAFLERKGWLRFGGRQDYLKTLFADYYQNEPQKRREANFHRTRLNTLFFLALNNQYGKDRLNSPDYQVFRARVGDAPYLNGGLFEQEANDESWFFPDTIVAKILNDLIYAYNFTITESTPLDIEVAVDPEMLGKIFEELVTGRHETGSYYTPKPVVSFMCRQALKAYLQTACQHEDPAALVAFVEAQNADGIHDPEGVLRALKAVKACDPACGSGAYLLGLLHELLDLRAALFAARQVDARTVYERKLEIIQNNLYGVDIDPFAVNIARLRLWLSLVVDNTRNPLEDPTVDVSLPNLDFKIETGDSLMAPDPSGGLELGFRKPIVDDFLRLRQQYLTEHDPAQKRSLRGQIQQKRELIASFAGHTAESAGFDWTVEFAEVFASGPATTTLIGAMTSIINAAPGQMQLPSESPQAIGFNVLLANPPYVRADAQFKHISNEQERLKEIQKWQAYRARLKNAKSYKTLHEKWDLYIPFLERAYQLLHPQGQMVFIIPDAYNAAKYASKSHEFFLQNSYVMRIDFCSEINLFDAGVNNTILHFKKGVSTANHQPVRTRRWGKRDEFDDNQENLLALPQSEFGKSLFKFNGKKDETAEGFVTLETICYISVGMVIHADERKAHLAFRANELITDTKDSTHPKPFVEGKDLVKWVFTDIHYLEYGTIRAPALFRRPTFPELYEVSEKLISMDLAGKEQKVAYDDKGLFHNHSAWSFVPWYLLKKVVNNSIKKAAKYRYQDPLGDRENRDELSRSFNLKYILAIMNSSFTREWLKHKRRSKMHIYPDDWKQLPIAPLPLEAQQPFVKKVDAILSEYAHQGYPLPPAAAQRVKDLEKELDEMVARLYES